MWVQKLAREWLEWQAQLLGEGENGLQWSSRSVFFQEILKMELSTELFFLSIGKTGNQLII